MENLKHCNLCDSAQIEDFCPANHFARCLDCGHVFDNPRPTADEITGFYAKQTQYDEWLRDLSARDEMWKRRLRLVLKHRSSGRLLDVGAGIGQFLSHAREKFDVSGSELSPIGIEIAKTRYQVELKESTLEKNSWPHSFDVITLFHVLEHFQSPAEALKQCAALLSEKGILCLAVPNDVQSVQTRRNRFMRKLGFKKYLSLGELGLPRQELTFSELHLSHFMVETLTRALERTGFRVLEATLDPYFAVSGKVRTFRRVMRYYFYRTLHQVFGLNLYDTIFIVAQKI